MLNSNEVLIGNFPSSRRFTPDHNGIDLKAPKGTPVISRFDGRLVLNGTNPTGKDFGNYCVVIYKNGLQGWYAHLDRHIRPLGEVRKGDVIGYSGNTGYVKGSTGYHLHYSESVATTTHWVDPDRTEVKEMIDDKFLGENLFKYSDTPEVYLRFTAESFNALVKDFSKVKDIGKNPVPILNKQIEELKKQLETVKPKEIDVKEISKIILK